MNRPAVFSRLQASRTRQTGVALMVVLILLVLMTLLALVSLRGTLMQERMSSSQYDRSLAFQSAEAALREAEATAGTKPDVPGSGCDADTTGVCAEPDPADAPRWLATNWNEISHEASDADLGTLAVKPRYIMAVSSNALHELYSKGSLPAGVAFMQKPFEPDTLIKALRDGVAAATAALGAATKRP